MVNSVSRDVEILHSKYFYLALIIIITSLLYIWPDFHPERIVVNEQKEKVFIFAQIKQIICYDTHNKNR
jgi:hypothetical protein